MPGCLSHDLCCLFYSLHPQIRGRRFNWTMAEGIASAEAKFEVFSSDLYHHNPLPHVIEKQSAIRRKLIDPDYPDDYIIIINAVILFADFNNFTKRSNTMPGLN